MYQSIFGSKNLCNCLLIDRLLIYSQLEIKSEFESNFLSITVAIALSLVQIDKLTGTLMVIERADNEM
ncbi:hypothetical protein H1P_2430014 [Hyella patelloides LEGE 07179]|uniref:Uncharacterized protein n=1 Tax=Hyella patelloides LEGE 07179 TaxID=945734 RepID=A0A563VRQ6_9CYAN|nr:hypothetical protein H1P_2430014 [Hyella patelloides LEGE 07179]